MAPSIGAGPGRQTHVAELSQATHTGGFNLKSLGQDTEPKLSPMHPSECECM